MTDGFCSVTKQYRDILTLNYIKVCCCYNEQKSNYDDD